MRKGRCLVTNTEIETKTYKLDTGTEHRNKTWKMTGHDLRNKGIAKDYN